MPEHHNLNIFRNAVIWFFLFVSVTGATNDIEPPLLSVVFTRYNTAPSGWEKYNVSNTTVTGQNFAKIDNVSPEFKFVFRAHTFTYIFSAPASGYYTLRLGLYEHQTCTPGIRAANYVVNGVSSPEIDIALLVGCREPYFLDMTFFVENDKLITLSFFKKLNMWAPVISNFRLFEGRPPPEGYTPEPLPAIPSVSPSPDPPPPGSVDETLNLGPETPVPGTKGIIYTSETAALDTVAIEEAGIDSAIFFTAISGNDFTLEFKFPPGSYDVTLGFIEFQRQYCAKEARIFDVLVNDMVQLKSYDIVTDSGSCRRAVLKMLKSLSVDPLSPKPFSVRFVSVSGPATLSYIRIKATESKCAQLSGAEIKEDHLAHAVPGIYPSNGDDSYVDSDGKGFVSVNIDGSSSHTHFANNDGVGELVSYAWTLPQQGKLISSTPKFTYKFPLGTTRLRLTVVDNACSRDEAETLISVVGNVLPGAYCYYYDGLIDLPPGGTLTKPSFPTFADVSPSLEFGFPEFSFSDSMFVVRCRFFLKFAEKSMKTKFSVNSDNTGAVRLYSGDDLIIDTSSSNESQPTMTDSGLSSYELVYLRTDMERNPVLKLYVNGTIPKTVLYDRSTVLPIISAIDPPFGSVVGGGRTKITGYGMFSPLKVFFGKATIAPDAESSTSSEIFVLAPAVKDPGTVQVSVKNSLGESSVSLSYEYGSECDPIRFEADGLKTSDGAILNLDQPTAISIWQNGKIFVGTRKGIIFGIEYDHETYNVKSLCHSETFVDSNYKDDSGNYSTRSILGLTFDPRDVEPKPYVSVSTVFWEKSGAISSSNPNAWSNGAVERFKPASANTISKDPQQCLEYDRNIIRNIPVSDGDHSVNELVFTQDGDLLVAVGSNTNAGLPFITLGGNWDSYFSGAIIIAHLSRGEDYDGTIHYSTPDNLRTAEPTTDDVELYATGLRNPFVLTMTRSGKIYSVDMGANCRFGNVSSSCDQYNETDAKLRSTTSAEPFPGFAVVGPDGECKYGENRPDKLVEIIPGKFYGHSNLQRAKHINAPGECIWIDPNTGLSPPPAKKQPPRNFERHLALLKSPMTGLREYGSNLFCGKLRGDLILSVYQGVKTYRLERDEDENVAGKPSELHPISALRVEETVQGSLILPGYLDDIGVLVLKPKVHSRNGLFVSNALPFRHGRKGGTLLQIGGWGFTENATVSVGNSNCEVIAASSSEIVCQVPPLQGDKLLADVQVSVTSAKSTLEAAVLYMEV